MLLMNNMLRIQMTRQLRIISLVVILFSCLAAQLPAAHVTACRSKDPEEKSCLCLYLGMPPEDKRVETNQREEIVADWLLQDGGLSIDTVRRIIDELGEAAGKLRDNYEKLSKSNVSPEDPALRALYLAACEKRRELLFEPHLEEMRRVVFTRHFNFGGSHYAYTEGMSDAAHEHHFQPGSSLCLLEMGDGVYPRCNVLLDDPGGVIRDPDVSHDAGRVVFAWKKSYHKDDYHLYEMDLKTKKTRQLTGGLGYADYEPVYLPDGNIVFSSTRCIQTVDCWFVEVSNLFTCDGDGRYIRRLGFDQVHTTLPTLTDDGRIIYTRWDYNDRGQMAVQSVFQMHPDGTNQRELYGNNSCYPTTILHTRSIANTGKYVGIISGHHTRQRGWLATIDPRKGRQEDRGVQLIAPVRETKAKTEDQHGQTGDQFQYPYPLSETAFLVGLRPSGPSRVFSIFFVTADGRRELLYRDRNISCNQPVPVMKRSIPRRASTVDYTMKTGTVYLHDVYSGPGLRGVRRGTIKKLRVVGLEFRSSGNGPDKSLVPEGLRLGAGNKGPVSGARVSCPISVGGGSWDVKKVLGNATVYEDGSACFKVPARMAVFFQALDEKGQMVQSMRSWTTLQPGETVSCVGCHERKNQAPPVPYFSQALAAGPQSLDRKPFEGEPKGFDFKSEIQPILDKHCVKCHSLDKDQEADLEKKLAFSLKWPSSYNSLADRKYCNWINAQSKPSMLPPYYTGAAQSKLIKMFEPGKHTIYSPAPYGKIERTATTVEGDSHYKVKLSQPEMNKLITWIDLSVPCLGDYAVPKDNYYFKKRKRWEAEEAENIYRFVSDSQ